MRTWDEVAAYTLTLPETELSTSYNQPAIKVRGNGRTVVNVGNEPDTSFALHLDAGTIDILKEVEPDTFWQSPHYEGYAVVLVRFDSPHPTRVREMIRRSRDHVAAMKPVRKR